MGDLAPLLEGWHPLAEHGGETSPTISKVGYYTHAGYVYLTGTITNMPPAAWEWHYEGLEIVHKLRSPMGGTWTPVGTTILTNLPSQLCPSSNVQLTFPIDPTNTLDCCNPVLNLPVRFHATMHTDGSLTLNEGLPPYLNEAPPEGTYYYVFGDEESGETRLPQYPNPLYVAIILGNARWPLAGGADTYQPKSLQRFISPHFASSDAVYAIHGSRVHLGGHAASETQPRHDLPIPSYFLAGWQVLVEHGPKGAYRGIEQYSGFGEPTTAMGPYGVVPLEAQYNEEVVVLSDEPIHKPTDDAPLTTGSPRPFSYAGSGGAGNNTTTSTGDGFYHALDGAGKVGDGAHLVQGEEIVCEYEIVKKIQKIFCLGPTKFQDLYFDMGAALNQFNPIPPWFSVELFIDCFFNGFLGANQFSEIGALSFKDWEDRPAIGAYGSYSCKAGLGGGGFGGDNAVLISPEFSVAGALLPTGEPDASIAQREEEAFIKPVRAPIWEGPLMPIDGPKYRGVAFPGEEHKKYEEQLASRLWRTNQVSPIAVFLPGYVGWGASIGWLTLTPYYEKRQFGLNHGDVLDMTLTGWRSGAGELEIGQGERAIIPKGQR